MGGGAPLALAAGILLALAAAAVPDAYAQEVPIAAIFSIENNDVPGVGSTTIIKFVSNTDEILNSRLIDSVGTQIAIGTATSPGIITGLNLADGTYYIQFKELTVTGWDGSEVLTHRYTHPSSTSVPVLNPLYVIATISAVQNDDGARTTTITYMGTGGAEVDGRLTDSDGNVIAEGPRGGASSILARDLQSGTDYFVQIKLPSQEYGDPGTVNHRYAHRQANPFTSITYDPPRITTSLTGHIATVGDEFRLDLEAADADAGDTVTFSTVGDARGATISGSTLRWTPVSSQLGANDITIRATDSDRQTDTQSVTIYVREMPVIYRSLTLPDIDDQSVNINSTFRLDIGALGAQGDVRYSLVDPPEGARIHPDTGHLVYIPREGPAGSRTLTIHASDGVENATKTVSFTVGDPIATVLSLTSSDAPPSRAQYTAGSSDTRSQFRFYTILNTEQLLGEGHGSAHGLVSAGATSGSLRSSNNVADPPHPRPDTVYYFVVIRDLGKDVIAFDADEDTSLFAQYTPGIDGFKIIPNPFTRPYPVAPDLTATANLTAPTVIAPDLVSMDGDTLVISAVTNGTKGNATYSDTAITYTPYPHTTGTDIITYTVTDDLGASSVGTATITIPPRPVALSLPDVEDLAVNVNSTLRLPITVSVASGPVTYSIDPLEGAYIHPRAGYLSYVPAPGQQGVRTLTIHASDGATTDTAAINVTVGDPIAAVEFIDASTGRYGTSVTASPDTGQLTGLFRSISGGDHANYPGANLIAPGDTKSFQTAGTHDRTPQSNTVYYLELRISQSGQDIPVSDDRNIYAQFTPGERGFVTIPNPNTRPVPPAPNMTEYVNVTAQKVITPELIGADGGPMIITAATTDGTKGRATNNDTTITYAPIASAEGSDTITYTVTDNSGATGTGTITVELLPDIARIFIPIIDDQSVRAWSTLRLDIEALNAKGPVAYSIDEQLGARIHPDTGHLVFVPNASHAGTSQTLRVHANDGHTSAVRIINVDVGEPLVRPGASGPSSGKTGFRYTTLTAEDILAQFKYYSVSRATNFSPLDYGEAKLDGSEALHRHDSNPHAGSVPPHPRPDTVYYVELRPDTSHSDMDGSIYARFTPDVFVEATTVIANPNTRPAPFAPDITKSMDEVATTVITPELTGADGGPVIIKTVTDGIKGRATNNDTVITYTPYAGVSGHDTVTYTVIDDRGVRNTGMATIEFPYAPLVARDDFDTTDEDVAASISVLNNDAAEDAQVSVSTPPMNGNATAEADGTITYTPRPDYNGRDSFEYNITRGSETQTATVTLRVISQNDPITFDVPPNTDGFDHIVIRELERYSFDINVTTVDDITYTFVVEPGVPPATNASITRQGNFSWTPDESTGGSVYPVTINLVPAGRSVVPQQIMLSVFETNQDPVFDDIQTNRMAEVGKLFSIDLDATDADRPPQTISYTIESQSPATNPADINEQTGLVSWTPDAHGSKIITVLATDDYFEPSSDSITLRISVPDPQAGNTPPTASSFDIFVNRSETVSVDLSEMHISDVEQDSATLAVTINDTPAQTLGMARASGTTITYDADDVAGTDMISYTVTDNGGLTATETVTVRVVVPKMPPYAPDNSTDTDEDVPVTLIPEISDPDGGTVAITAVTDGRLGRADHTSTTVTYMPRQDLFGNDTITYTVTDDEGETATGTINITINPINDDPVIGALGDQNVAAGSNLNFTVIVNDAERDTLRFTLEGPRDAILDRQGYFTWTPTDDDVGNYTVVIRVSDGRGGTDSETIVIRVKERGTVVNRPPALDSIDNQQISEGQTLRIRPAAIDDDGDPLTYSLERGTLPGAATFNTANGHLDWTPGAGDGGTSHDITITVSDGQDSDSESITITVIKANQNPVIAPVEPQTAVVGQQLTVRIMADDPDEPSQTLSYRITGDDLGADISGNVVTWTPNPSHVGNRSITVLVEDDYSPRGSATVVIPITVSLTAVGPIGPNRDPVAPDILINAELHFPSAVTPAVTDPDGDDITITRVTGNTLGSLDTSMLPQISYTPSQTGIDRLSYMASDNKGGTDTGTITIFINPDGNARPALDHIYNIGGRVGVDLEFTATADDSDDTSLTFDIANAPDGASITPGGDFSWRPTPSQNGTHTVTFIVHDDSGGADWQHVLVTILRADETNLPPVPQDIDAGVVLGGGRGFQPDISDPENDGTEIVRVYDSSLGDVDRSFTSQGIIVYVAGVLGNDEVIYTVSDGRGGFANGTISITVEEPANVRPLIEFVGDKSVNANNELAFTVDARDLDGFVINFGLEGETQGPSMSPQGVFSWTPTANDVGRHEFTILVFDDAGDNSSVTIAVTVRPEGYRNSPPVAPDVVIMTPQDVLSIVRPTLTDPDEGDPVRISGTGNTAKGSILTGFLRAGIIIYLPNQGETGTETITYTVSDSSDDTDTATINVFISARGNTDPILGSIDFRNINAGNPLRFDLEAEDPDGDAISYQLVGAPGAAAVSSQGAFIWIPTAADVGNHTFAVIAYDDRGGADSKSAVIRVLPAGTANQVPNAPDSSVTVTAGGSVVITPAISDPDGDRVTIDDAVASGTGVVIPSEDSINYIHIATTPTETITYTVTDARGATSTGTITVTVQ